MTMLARTYRHTLLLLLAFLSIALAASPTSFCKCTCFNKNSTIIPLDALDTTSRPLLESDDDLSAEPNPSRRTCSDCTKQFCLNNNLPICKAAEEDDVFTTCFQRDSTKDQLVVYVFILATGGLLTWAAVRPWYEKWRGAGNGGAYAHVNAPGAQR